MDNSDHKVVLPLLKSYDRPIISLYNVNALVDPGSVPLIIDMDNDTVSSLFGGQYTGRDVEVKGIGTGSAKVYILKHFCLGTMTFRDFPALIGSLEDKETPIVIGCSMYARGSKCLIDTESNEVTFYFSEVFFRAGRPCIRHKDGWGFLDYQNGHFVALPITI